jgi:hypothetical protein
MPGIMLGKSGIVMMSEDLAVVFESEEELGVWLVGSLASDDDLTIHTTAFAGPKARARATEYAYAKYARVNFLDGRSKIHDQH